MRYENKVIISEEKASELEAIQRKLETENEVLESRVSELRTSLQVQVMLSDSIGTERDHLKVKILALEKQKVTEQMRYENKVIISEEKASELEAIQRKLETENEVLESRVSELRTSLQVQVMLSDSIGTERDHLKVKISALEEQKATEQIRYENKVQVNSTLEEEVLKLKTCLRQFESQLLHFGIIDPYNNITSNKVAPSSTDVVGESSTDNDEITHAQLLREKTDLARFKMANAKLLERVAVLEKRQYRKSSGIPLTIVPDITSTVLRTEVSASFIFFIISLY